MVLWGKKESSNSTITSKKDTVKRNGTTKKGEIGYNSDKENSQPKDNKKIEKKKSSLLSTVTGKTYCQACKKKCSGEVLRVQDKYFHIDCFKCKVCRDSLAQGGFFCKDGEYFCTSDYQQFHGTKCGKCGEYVEGEVVTALGNTYHQKCFTCARCRQAFPSGERVTFTGKEVLCQKCSHIPIIESQSPQQSPTSGQPACAGCREELKEGQALIALDKQWHVWCFKCKECDTVLHGEYMGRDGVPYCEKDYQKEFGVRCAYCKRYISGKVLQAGDNHHFHPTCARCTKCGDPFGDGEEMYLQGTAIWHPRCGPGPTENGTILNGTLENGHTEDRPDSKADGMFDGMSSSVSETQYSSYRTSSPGLILREYRTNQYPDDITRIYTYSYLSAEPTQGYLKRPIDPYDKPPTSPHFHRPSNMSRGKLNLPKTSSKSGMKQLVESIATETPRPRSPHMNNEEPIELAHWPNAKPPGANEKAKIERDDFPAPPYPYTDPERRKRWSDSYKGVPESEDEDEPDRARTDDAKLKREEEELSKIATGIGKVFLQNVKEREKIRQWKITNVDPRNASRTPNASKEPNYRLRYESPVNALVSSLRTVPKPGYGLKSSTLPVSGRNGGPPGYIGEYTYGLGDKTHSTEFSSGKSDISVGSITEADTKALNAELHCSSTYASGFNRYHTSSSYSPHLRRSLPSIPQSNEPPKVYPYHLLVTSNYRLPIDVDRCNLERHLSDAEFDALFHMSRVEFYRIPNWRRNELKRRAKLY